MKIGNQCAFSTFRTTGRQIWGTNVYQAHRKFFLRTEKVAQALKQKAQSAGFTNNFKERTFYAAARLAFTFHIEIDGSPNLRKSGEPYAFHMLRILERLTEDDVPYLGWQAYVATWLHDTLEDTNLTFKQIKATFGLRVANIVNTLSNLKVSKFQTKLEQAEIYDPRFAEETRDYLEALYIKLADVDDYFNTCEKLSEESKFFHFRFVNEVLYPLAVPVVGAQELALKVANKALEVQNKGAYNRNSRPIEELADEKLFADIAEQFSSLLSRAGIKATVQVAIRTPYEMYLKGKKIEETLRRDRQFLQRTMAGEHLFYARNEDSVGELIEITKKEKPELRMRDTVFYDIVAENEEDCYRAKKILCRAFSTVTIRSRDFIAHQKPNGYRGLHEEFVIGPENHRVRILTPEMQKLNRLGLGYKLLSSQGMKAFSSLLLSGEVLTMIQTTDREGRRLILGRFSDVRQVQLELGAPLPSLPSTFELPVWRQDTLLDVLTLAHPLLALKFSSARWQGNDIGWGAHNRLDPRKSFDWYTGQSLLLRLHKRWTGHNLHIFLQNPLARRDIKIFIAEKLSRRSQIAIGRSMVTRALRQPRYQIEGLNSANFGTVLENKTDRLEHELYQALAIGEISIFHIMQTLYMALERS